MPSGRILQLGFLASHRGTNLQAILDACKTGRLQARPRVVISNNSARVVATGTQALRPDVAAHCLW